MTQTESKVRFLRRKKPHSLYERYPPSEPCRCDVCKSYCRRPGWWTVTEAKQAIDAGYGLRMMLEMAPDFTYGVLSPAFRGCEANFALQEFAECGCNFLCDGLCELHHTGLQPLECRFCHHARNGLGTNCHAALERDWHTSAGQNLMIAWAKSTGLWQKYSLYL